MILWFYTTLILCFDLLVFILHSIVLYAQAFYRLFIPPSEKAVDGEIALVTGAGHGIGREIALQLGELGCVIVCADINKELCDQTMQDIRRIGGHAFSYVCDVSDRKAVEAMISQVRQEIGEVTLLVNNAGIMPSHRFLSYNSKEIERIFGVNTLAHFWTTQALLPHMIENKKGHIVAMCSVAGVIGTSNLIPYCASKFAVHGMMEALGEEMRKEGYAEYIKLTTVHPFIVDTGLAKKPRTRFPALLPICSPAAVASQVIKGILRNDESLYIPEIQRYIYCFSRLMPLRVQQLAISFMDAGVDAADF